MRGEMLVVGWRGPTRLSLRAACTQQARTWAGTEVWQRRGAGTRVWRMMTTLWMKALSKRDCKGRRKLESCRKATLALLIHLSDESCLYP